VPPHDRKQARAQVDFAYTGENPMPLLRPHDEVIMGSEGLYKGERTYDAVAGA
jgi:hypothetical protein